MTQDKIREAFEARQRKIYGKPPRIYHDGKYYGGFQSLWEEYQACAAEMAKDMEKMREALETCCTPGHSRQYFDESLVKEALALADKWRG